MTTHGDRQVGFVARPGPSGGGAPSRCLPAMRLLASGVPLSLIMDLALPGGPRSREILQVEGQPDEPWWDHP